MLKWEDGTPRSLGGPFDILYTSRAKYTPTLQEQMNKRSRQLSRAKQAIARDNSACGFAIALQTQSDTDKQQSIKKAKI